MSVPPSLLAQNHPLWGLLALSSCLLLGGCTRRPALSKPAPSPALPTPVRIPPGCEQNLSGTYRHAQNPRYTYRATDDGLSLRLDVTLETPLPDVHVLLQRTPEGFVGATHASVRTPQGAQCQVVFPTELTACTPQGLTLSTAASVAVDELCLPPSTPAPTALTPHQLLRAPSSPGGDTSGNPP